MYLCNLCCDISKKKRKAERGNGDSVGGGVERCKQEALKLEALTGGIQAAFVFSFPNAEKGPVELLDSSFAFPLFFFFCSCPSQTKETEEPQRGSRGKDFFEM